MAILAGGSEVCYELRGLRKTYGVKKIPGKVFRECQLAKPPDGNDWRDVCGSARECRTTCPRCWILNIKTMIIYHGTSTAILGHSGSGKTTLLNMLALLDRPDSDTEQFDLSYTPDGARRVKASCLGNRPGLNNGSNSSFNELRRNLFGFVFQAGHLTSHLNSTMNVQLPQGLNGAEVKDMRERAKELFERIDFPAHRVRALPRHLSGGEYQRVAVARALSHDPQLVFADEPTGNLDPVTGEMVMDLLTGWREQNGQRTLLLVTHNVQHALNYCDRVVVLSGGKVTLDAATGETSSGQINAALRPPALAQ